MLVSAHDHNLSTYSKQTQIAPSIALILRDTEDIGLLVAYECISY